MLKVMKLYEYDKAISYRVACDCGDPDHDLTVELEIDENWPDMTLHLYGNMEYSSYWGNLNWFQRQWKKIKGCFKLFFTGYIELEQEYMFQKEEHIQSFIDALTEGKQLLNERNKK